MAVANILMSIFLPVMYDIVKLLNAKLILKTWTEFAKAYGGTYLYVCGESASVHLKAPALMMNDLIDWFGRDFRIVSKTGDEIVISVKCNYNAMFYWALQYGAYVEVLSPPKLRKELAETIRAMNEKYGCCVTGGKKHGNEAK